MDLRTIREKLLRGEYNQAGSASVLRDVDLVWSNCLRYTPDPQAYINLNAERLKQSFAVFVDAAKTAVKLTAADTMCSICQDDVLESHPDTAVTQLDCLHIFHSKCVENWFNQCALPRLACPNCKKRFAGLR